MTLKWAYWVVNSYQKKKNYCRVSILIINNYQIAAMWQWIVCRHEKIVF